MTPPQGPRTCSDETVGLSSREIVGGVRIELNVAKVTKLKRRAGDVRVDRRCRQRSLRRGVDGDGSAHRLLDPGERRHARSHRRTISPSRSATGASNCLMVPVTVGARSDGVHLEPLDRHIVLAQIDLAGQPIDRGLAILDAHVASGRVELNLVPIGEVVAVHLDRTKAAAARRSAAARFSYRTCARAIESDETR